MTYQDIIDNANIINDEFRTPFNDNDRSAVLLYMSIVEFISQAYKQGEKNERRRQDLIDLVKPIAPAGGTKIINLSNIDNFMYTFELTGTFTDSCDSTKTFTRPIKPLKLDKHQRAMIDTFEKPDDLHPRYIEYNDTFNTLEVLSDTTPVSYKMFYIKQPKQPNPVTLSIDSPEFGSKRTVCIEVSQILSRKFLMETDDPRYTEEQNEINLNRLEPVT